MKKLTLLPVLFLAIFTNLLTAQNVNIPDANFKAALVANSSINTNADGEIQVSEATAYTGSMTINGLSISDLTGIEKFTGITSIDASVNSLSNINLFYNTQLTSVNVSSNTLTCLDLSHNPNVTTLDCGSNNLTALNLKNGNNTILTSYNSLSAGSMLYCIQVDNPTFSNANWTAKDTWSVYNTTCGSAPNAAFTHDAPVCTGTQVTFTNTTTLADWYIWDLGDGNYTTQTSPAHTYVTGSYYVTLVAFNCNSTDTVTQQVIQGTTLYGQALTPSLGAPLDNGVAILYPYQTGFVSFDTIAISPIDPNGLFTFGHIAQGDYIVKVIPDPTDFPTLYPTYADSTWAWDTARVFNHGCTADTYPAVTLLETPSIGTGGGYVQGFVIEGVGFGRAQGDPVHGVDVKLGFTANSQIVHSTETDNNGMFEFSSLPNGTYTVFVDIAGLERDSVYSFTIDNANQQFTNLYYGVDSVKVYIVENIGIEDQSIENTKNLLIRPNPVREQAIITYIIETDNKVQIDIYNSLGTKVQSLLNANVNPGEYQLNYNPTDAGLKPGLYFVTLSSDNKTITKRFLILN